MLPAAPIGAQWFALMQTGGGQNWILPGENIRPAGTIGIFVQAQLCVVRAGSDVPQGRTTPHSLPAYLMFDRPLAPHPTNHGERVDAPDRFAFWRGTVSTGWTILPRDIRLDALSDDERAGVEAWLRQNAAAAAAAAAAAVAAAVYNMSLPVGVTQLRDPPPLVALNSSYKPEKDLRAPLPQWLVRSFETTRTADSQQTICWLDDWPTA